MWKRLKDRLKYVDWDYEMMWFAERLVFFLAIVIFVIATVLFILWAISKAKTLI